MLTLKQLKARKFSLGGSECATVLGRSKFYGNTPLKIYLDKISPKVVKRIPTDRQKLGSLMEPIIRREFQKETRTKVKVFKGFFKNEKYPWLHASIDGWILTPEKELSSELLEIKTVDFFDRKDWGEQYTDDVPQDYLLQCAQYCIVCDSVKKIDRVKLKAWSRATGERRDYVYERNAGLEELILDLTHDFWNQHIVSRVPPAPVNRDDLHFLYSLGYDDKSIIADGEQEKLVYEIAEIKEQEKLIKTQKEDLENQIKLIMKENAYLCDDDGKILTSWRNEGKKGSRVFRVKATRKA